MVQIMEMEVRKKALSLFLMSRHILLIFTRIIIPIFMTKQIYCLRFHREG